MFGWLIGLAATTAVFVQLPRLLDGLNRPPPTWAAWVRIAIGIALIALAVWRWVTRHRAATQPAWLSRLSRLTPIGAGAIAMGLILVNPKVLVMNAAAGVVIGTATLEVSGVWVAIAYYTAIAGSSVLVPILAYAVAGQRVDHQLEWLKRWMERQHAVLMAGFLAVVGLLLVYTGIRAV
jgi:threonine/homoserine/homoserine lactone efflux protein